jgi:hypothetical protein
LGHPHTYYDLQHVSPIPHFLKIFGYVGPGESGPQLIYPYRHNISLAYPLWDGIVESWDLLLLQIVDFTASVVFGNHVPPQMIYFVVYYHDLDDIRDVGAQFAKCSEY